MKVTADRHLNPMLASILFVLAAAWTLSAVTAANYARRHGPELSWVKKVLHLPAGKRKHVSHLDDVDAVA